VGSAPLDLGAHPLPGESHDLAGLGVSAELGLGEDHLAVEGDLEAALVSREEVDALDDRRPAP